MSLPGEEWEARPHAPGAVLVIGRARHPTGNRCEVWQVFHGEIWKREPELFREALGSMGNRLRVAYGKARR